MRKKIKYIPFASIVKAARKGGCAEVHIVEKGFPKLLNINKRWVEEKLIKQKIDLCEVCFAMGPTCPLCHVSVTSSILPAVVMKLTHSFQAAERYYHSVPNAQPWMVKIASNGSLIGSWIKQTEIHLTDSSHRFRHLVNR